MRFMILLMVIIQSYSSFAYNPLHPLVKRDTVSYFRCYMIDEAQGSTGAPYTFFKIRDKYYEGVNFPFLNDGCLENISKDGRDSIITDHQSSVDTIGERKVYDFMDHLFFGKFAKEFNISPTPEVLACFEKYKMQGFVYQFFRVDFVAHYYIIRCDKPRNCEGPDIICTELIDISRTPVFTKIERILE